MSYKLIIYTLKMEIVIELYISNLIIIFFNNNIRMYMYIYDLINVTRKYNYF